MSGQRFGIIHHVHVFVRNQTIVYGQKLGFNQHANVIAHQKIVNGLKYFTVLLVNVYVKINKTVLGQSFGMTHYALVFVNNKNVNGLRFGILKHAHVLAKMLEIVHLQHIGVIVNVSVSVEDIVSLKNVDLIWNGIIANVSVNA